jgi:hypothetical protein
MKNNKTMLRVKRSAFAAVVPRGVRGRGAPRHRHPLFRHRQEHEIEDRQHDMRGCGVVDGDPKLLPPALAIAAYINEAPTRAELNCRMTSPQNTRNDLVEGMKTGQPVVAFVYVLTRRVRAGEQLLSHYGLYARVYVINH